MAHTHPVVDSDSRFVINSTTREISTTSDKLELIQGDHQSERITFEIPKIVEGHDMSLSDRIEVHYINIDRRTNATSRDVYIIDDAAVDGDKLTFSWLISGNATKYYGRLNFIILFECLDPDGNYTYKWNTEICKLLTIGEGISNTSAVIEDHSDILEKFKKEILEEAGEKSIQPDWNQNDETAADYVKNRPFYTGDPVETVLVEESTVSFSGLSGGIYQGKFSSTFSPTIGETYKISWDGTVYECVCASMRGVVVIGNASIAGTGSDSGEPFFMIAPGKGEILIGSTEASDSHTFSIRYAVPQVVQIDEKYLPEGYPTKSVGTVTLMEEQQVAFILDKDIYVSEEQNAFEIVAGQTYTVNWDGAEYECVSSVVNSVPIFGNLSILNAGNDTGEPFICGPDKDRGTVIFYTHDTSASHTISVKKTGEIFTPMAEEFLPATAFITYDLSTDTYSSDLTNDKLYARLLDGKQIVLYTTDGNEYRYLTRWIKKSNGSINLAFAGDDYSVSLFPDGTIRKYIIV